MSPRWVEFAIYSLDISHYCSYPFSKLSHMYVSGVNDSVVVLSMRYIQINMIIYLRVHRVRAAVMMILLFTHLF